MQLTQLAEAAERTEQVEPPQEALRLPENDSMGKNEYQPLIAAAYVRGAARNGKLVLPQELADMPLEALTDAELGQIIDIGGQAGLRLYHFKEKDDLPRVAAVLGFLRGVRPRSLLDVGSGRGAFLFPFLREFPEIPVTAVDLLPHRVELLSAVVWGGVDRLTVLQKDICDWDAPPASFDVVTLLEVLEHIPEVERAVAAAVRLAQRYVVVTVPSKPDNNPEHIHLLTKEKLTGLFAQAGCKRLKFGGVNGHLLAIASLNNEKGGRSDAGGTANQEISPNPSFGRLPPPARG